MKVVYNMLCSKNEVWFLSASGGVLRKFLPVCIKMISSPLPQGTRRAVPREFQDRTCDAVERVDERPLVPGGLYGGCVGHVRTRADIHNNGHLCAAIAHDVRDDMGRGGPGCVQGQRVPVHQRWH